MMDFRAQRSVSRHAHVKMSWIKHEVYKNSPQFSVTIHQTTTHSSSQGIKISPAILFIIIILAVLFFISGLLHLLVRFLTKYHASSSTAFHQPNNRYTHGSATHDTLQRQLQQLFNMNDSGLDRAFIDALPVFMYKEIVGAKESFDCAVCLCEFCEMDKLRLLPACSHAFHIQCIDTWLVSNSTCPLCRNALFSPGISMDNPVFEFDDMREAEERRLADGLKTTDRPEQLVAEKGVFMVRLGKFRRLITEGDQKDSGETSSRKLDARRCYSMGSYEYVVGDTSLKLALNDNRESRDRENGKIVEGEESGDGNLKVNDETEGKKISMSAKTDSYSVSKIWLWSKKGNKLASSSENQVHNPSSVDMELPWMGRMRGT